MKLTGAELIVRILEEQGIELVSGIPGGAALPLYDALAKSKTIHHVLARHEQGAGFIAQGMSRATGKPGVCIASSGPGATNLITAIADAKLDSIPLICITAQVSSFMIGTDAFQEVDTYGISIPVTKHNFLVRDVNDLPRIMSQAFRIATEGRPGPVWIDVPKDIQLQEIEYTSSLLFPETTIPSELEDSLINDAVKMLSESLTPIIYFGGGIISADAAELAVRFAEKVNAPVVCTLMALGAIPVYHPLYLGMLGMHGTRATNYAMEKADLLFVLGARFDDRAIGKASQFCPNAKVVHVDIDNAELGKIRKPELEIQSDVRSFLVKINDRVSTVSRSDWLACIDALKTEFPLQTPDIENPLSHYGLIRAAAEVAGESVLVVTDVGQHQMWVAQSYPFSSPRQFLTSGGLGTMGFGLPAAIGASLVSGEVPVLCFTGDGSIMMNIQELATAAEEKVNVKIILMNNNALGLVHQQQELFYSNNLFASDYSHQVNFLKIAEGFGFHTVNLNEQIDPVKALFDAINTPGPVFIHTLIDVNQKVYPMVAPGSANTNMIGG
ncbi:acetolactate synthase large subunit (plasmid) [Pantoea sp. JZ29]|uniref:acetolactate synthase large subunit n=1 Tax=Pantoea sp. JZ29 TaxID=2654192 RepID=UPI002B485C97|nr:acetolactate synthase large subunit [Pantoea sp. JZ29]WRH23365.1 acetolactate synthase large subunit [Pantoea sp. JZ29]